jgi:hypothetical protein
MKTTVELPADLLRRAKAEAALQGRSFKDLLIDAIREKLDRRAGRGEEIAAELRRMWAEAPTTARAGKPYKFSRIDAYDAGRTGGKRG